MDSESSDLSFLINEVKKGKASLFIGPLCAQGSGAYTREELTDEIKNKFTQIDQSIVDFYDVCQEVVDTPKYGAETLRSFLSALYEGLEPSPIFDAITKFHWRGIFTDNIDNLLESAYRKSNEKKSYQVVVDMEQSTLSGQSDKVYIFKLKGSFDSKNTEEFPVLTRYDQMSRFSSTKKLLEHLPDLIKDGPLIFLGCDPRENSGFEILDECVRKYKIYNIPHSYAIFDNEPANETELQRLTRRNIIPLKGTTQEFFELLERDKEITPKYQESNLREILTIKGKKIYIDNLVIRNLEQFCEVLTDKKLKQEVGEKDDFFKGVNRNWSAFGQNWDFERDFYKKLKERTLAEIQKTDPSDNEVLLLKGIPGSGKTMAIRRLAFEIYASGIAPVVLLEQNKLPPDFKVIDSFIQEVNREYDKAGDIRKSSPNIKILILIDDLFSIDVEMLSLRNYFSARSRSCLVIGAVRDSEVTFNPVSELSSLPKANVFSVPDEISNSEIEDLRRHLVDLGYLETEGAFSSLRGENDNSFFATMYTLVDPAKRPLNQIIKDQFEILSDAAREAFLFVCSINQYNLSLNLELLVRAMGGSFELFLELLNKKEVMDVIVEDSILEENLSYRTHHRIIARRTLDFFAADHAKQFELFSKMLSNVNFGFEHEKELVESLLVKHLGYAATDTKLSLEMRAVLFELVCKQEPNKTLLHHFGKLEQEMGHYKEAEKLMRDALQYKERSYDYSKGESDRNILVSLGSLYSEMASKELSDEKIDEATEHFKIGLDYFRRASVIDPVNPYPYHGSALLYYKQALAEEEYLKKLDSLGKALEQIQLGISNINPEDIPILLQLKEKVFTELGEESKIEEVIDELRTRYNSSEGYKTLVTRYIQDAEDLKNKPGNEQTMERLLLKGLDWTMKGLTFFKDDEFLLNLKATIFGWLYPRSHEEYYRILMDWNIRATKPNLKLLFDLGIQAFITERYYESFDIFRKLERSSEIKRNRSFNQVYFKNEEDEVLDFEGQIDYIRNDYSGEIKCLTLRLKRSLHFRPVSASFRPSVGDNVTFNIAFNYRGPHCTNVRKGWH